MKNTIQGTNNQKLKSKIEYVVWLLIILYVGYFTYSSVLRYQTLYASYFDLGIMHQTVYNSFQAIKKFDFSRFLELTNPYGPEQIKRMAIHNDIILGLISLLYFIYPGPETLLVLQTIVVGLGGWIIYKICQKIFEKNKYKEIIGLVFTFVYFIYPPLERSNLYDFHAVVLATTLLLLMYYFWLQKKYWLSFLFFAISLLTKEQIALTTLFFGAHVFYQSWLTRDKKKIFSIAIILISGIWFLVANFVIIPYFRGESHFALKYYNEITDNPGSILGKYLLSKETFVYLGRILGPIGFISLTGPLQLLITLPELAINLLSSNINMRNIYYQYSAVITPFIFISAIYGFSYLSNKFKKMVKPGLLFITIAALFFAYIEGPLPGAKYQEIHPFQYPQAEISDTRFWAGILSNEKWKISTTGQLAPYFTSRRYFYTFSQYYYLADYVVIRPNEIYNYPEKDQLIPVYEKIKRDYRFNLIYKKANFEVYKKI